MRSDGNGSTRRPQEIQAEIERTRREMDGTLSAIEERLTPGQIFDQGVQYLRNSGGAEFVSNLGDQAKQNPMPVALVGIGLAWLMATGRIHSGTQSEPGFGQKALQAKARLGETASAVRDKATQVRDTAQAQVDRAKSSLDSMMREQPLAIGAIGLAIGALAAALTPGTRQEEQIARKIDEEAAKPQTDEELAKGVKPYAERDQSEPPA